MRRLTTAAITYATYEQRQTKAALALKGKRVKLEIVYIPKTISVNLYFQDGYVRTYVLYEAHTHVDYQLHLLA